MAAHRYWRIKINNNTLASSQYVLLCEVKMYLRGTATLATGGTASASGSTSTASRAIDGSATTYWEYQNSRVFPQWWQCDFGAGNAKDIGQIDISSYSSFSSEMPSDFEIQWSDDGTTFTSVFRVQRMYWAVSQTFSFPVPDAGDTNYYAYRLNVAAVNGNTFISVAEIALRSTSGGSNLALSKAAFDTVNDGTQDARRAFDGLLTGSWETAVSGPTSGAAGVVMPAAITLVEMTISTRSDVNRNTAAPKNFSLEGSTDGVTWSTMQSWSNQTGWTQGETRTFSLAPAVIARPQIFVCT